MMNAEDKYKVVIVDDERTASMLCAGSWALIRNLK